MPARQDLDGDLCAAALAGDAAGVAALLKGGAAASAATAKNGWSALHYAATGSDEAKETT